MQWFDLNKISANTAALPLPHDRWAVRGVDGAPLIIEGVQPHDAAPCVHLLTEGAPGLLRLWPDSGRLLTIYPPAESARVAHRGERAALLRANPARRGRHILTLVDLASGDELEAWEPPRDARLGPWSRYLSEGPRAWGHYTVIAPRHVTLHRPGAAAVVKKLKLSTPCRALTTSGDGTRVVLSEDRVIWSHPCHRRGADAWELASAGLGVATALAASRDGGRIAIARDAPTLSLRLCACNTPTRIIPLDDAVTALATSPDDAWLALGHRSGRLSLRDALTGEELVAVQAHGGPVTALAWAGEDLWTCAGGGDLARWSRPAAAAAERAQPDD